MEKKEIEKEKIFRIFSVRMSEELFNKINTVAKKLRRTNNWIIRDILESYVDKYDIEETKKG